MSLVPRLRAGYWDRIRIGSKSVIMTSQNTTIQNLIATMCECVCVSLSLVVEDSDATVVTAHDEGWGSGRVG